MELDFLNVIDEKQEMLDALADALWDDAETAYREFRSASRLCRALREEGFAVEEGLAGIPTAFSGRFGAGRPVIGILGEFDALEGLGQVAGVAQKRPNGRKSGHGCGHNLLGAGSLGAALAVKRFLERGDRPGTVIYFGCPAEEGGSGKAFMARDGVFDQLDAALCWHPDVETGVRTKLSLANCLVLYKFDGRAAHAGAYPHLGRSALDAVELMNVGANYLREHMIPEARVHYAITDTGGSFPNVVQAHAEVLYMIRAPRGDQVRDLYARVCDIAAGAALMAGVQVEHVFLKACSNIILNDAMQQDLYEKMLRIGAPEITAQDEAFAAEMARKALSEFPEADARRPIHWEIRPYAAGQETPCFSSTDVGDVSWICPTAQVAAATAAYGTPGHSWQMTAQGKTPLAHKMTRFAAKAMAATAAELIANAALLQKAREEHRRRVGKSGYVPPIPQGVRPRALEDIAAHETASV